MVAAKPLVMRCWHIQRPMTPVPIQPMRVLPGSALLMAMKSSSQFPRRNSRRAAEAQRQEERRTERAGAAAPLFSPSLLSSFLCASAALREFFVFASGSLLGFRRDVEELPAAGAGAAT